VSPHTLTSSLYGKSEAFHSFFKCNATNDTRESL
jgi:hypothetical protein